MQGHDVLAHRQAEGALRGSAAASGSECSTPPLLTQDITATLKRRRPSSILDGMRYGTLRGFIPHYVWAEAPRVLADLKNEGRTFDLAAAERLWWQQYIPCLHVVCVNGLPRCGAEFSSHVLVGHTLGAGQDDPAPQCPGLWRGASPHPALECGPFLVRQHQLGLRPPRPCHRASLHI